MIKKLVPFWLAFFVILTAMGAYAAVGEKSHKKVIIMGGSTKALRNATQQDAEITFNTLLDEALKGAEMRMNLLVFPTTEALYAAFDKGDIDGMFGTAVEYLAYEDRFGEEIMALGFKDSGVKQRFVVVARKSDGLSQLKELRNKRLTIAKYQDVESVFLNTLLLRSQLPESPEFFSEQLDARNPSVAIMNVFFGKSDVTVVRESELQTAIELNPQIGKKLTVLEKSVPYVPAMGSARKTIPKEQIIEMVGALKKTYTTETGRNVLSYSQAVSLESIQREDLQSVRDLLNEYNSLKKVKIAAPITPGTRTREKRRDR